MVFLYLAAAGAMAWFLFTQIRYLIKGSPEKQREEAAYRPRQRNHHQLDTKPAGPSR